MVDIQRCRRVDPGHVYDAATPPAALIIFSISMHSGGRLLLVFGLETRAARHTGVLLLLSSSSSSSSSACV